MSNFKKLHINSKGFFMKKYLMFNLMNWNPIVLWMWLALAFFSIELCYYITELWLFGEPKLNQWYDAVTTWVFFILQLVLTFEMAYVKGRLGIVEVRLATESDEKDVNNETNS